MTTGTSARFPCGSLVAATLGFCSRRPRLSPRYRGCAATARDSISRNGKHGGSLVTIRLRRLRCTARGYDWAQQYSVSSGDFVGSLPVGMQSRGTTDLPYWPSANMYVYKEVWVHPSSRWLWLMADLVGGGRPASSGLDIKLSQTADADGGVTIRLTASGVGRHTFALRSDNLVVRDTSKTVTLSTGRSVVVEWKVSVVSRDLPWAAVVVPDADPTRARDVIGTPAVRSGRLSNRNAAFVCSSGASRFHAAGVSKPTRKLDCRRVNEGIARQRSTPPLPSPLVREMTAPGGTTRPILFPPLTFGADRRRARSMSWPIARVRRQSARSRRTRTPFESPLENHKSPPRVGTMAAGAASPSAPERWFRSRLGHRVHHFTARLLEHRHRDGAFGGGIRPTFASIVWQRAHRSRDRLIPFLDGPAILACLLEMNQSGALQRGDVMVEPSGRLAEQLGDVLGRFRASAKSSMMRRRSGCARARSSATFAWRCGAPAPLD